MTAWVVRAGRRGEQEQLALQGNVTTIHWKRLPDLSAIQDKKSLETLYTKTHPDASDRQVAHSVGQVWAFCKRIELGDIVLLPLMSERPAVAVGKVTGQYRYRSDLGEEIRHTRSVQWLRTDVLRSDFQQDIRSTLNVRLTVYRIGRPNAETRIQAVLNRQTDPGPGEIEEIAIEEAEVNEIQTSDVEQTARDQLLDYIQNKFTRHRLADLVDTVLQAEGYLTKVSSPGPDGGVDILAATGPMGFGSPKLCVQVKSSKDRADVKLLRELKGILKDFGAEQGLLVCWGGFTAPTQQEARQNFFNIRLWDQEDLLEAIMKNYERFPEDMQAELPLKRVWTLVTEEEG